MIRYRVALATSPNERGREANAARKHLKRRQADPLDLMKSYASFFTGVHDQREIAAVTEAKQRAHLHRHGAWL